MRQIILTSLATLGILVGCGDSTEPAHEDHTPVRFEATVNGAAVTDDTLRLSATAGVDTVRFTFFNAADDNLDDHEADHFSLLTFTPAAGIATTVDPSHHFRHAVEVTAPAGTAGDVEVGYGHDATADEYSFSLHYLVVP
jgi:hypothetical protein